MPPQILALSFGEDGVNAGDTVAVQCTVVKGDAPIELQWLFDGVPLRAKAGDGIVVTAAGQRVSMLSVEAVQARHSGEYTCTASNPAGRGTQTAVLNVQGTSPPHAHPAAACEVVVGLVGSPSHLLSPPPKPNPGRGI